MKQKQTKEFNFFIKADLRRYRGRYIAIIADKVVASGNDAKEVWGRATREYPEQIPTLAKLPKEEALILMW